MPTPAYPQLFEAIVANLSDGVYVLQDNRTIFLNERCGEIFGYSSIEGLLDRDMFATVYPDRQSVDLFRKIHDQVLAGNPPRIAWGQPSAKLDGTPFWIEVEARRIEVGGRPAIFGTFHDRTDCKLIGEAMHATQETLRLLLDAMEDRVYVVTDDYRIVYANRKMLAGVCGDLTVDPCYKVCRGLEERCEDCSTDKVFASDQPIHKEFFNERTKSWYSVIELAIRMPGIDQPTKLAVARDITRKKEAEKKVRALSHRLLTAQENERKHLSRELHDDLGQRLNAVKIGIDTLAEDLADSSGDLLARVQYLSRVLQDSIQSVRHLSAGLRPDSLERLGLVGAIRNDSAKLVAAHGLRIDFKTAGMKGIKLDNEAEINLYRVFQEALNNVIKHARATAVGVRLIASHPIIRMRIEDNGRGFDMEGPAVKSGGGLGLVGMAERVDLLSGTFEVVSRPGGGTRIVVEVPISPVPQKDQSQGLGIKLKKGFFVFLSGVMSMCELA
ncbi:MAG: PAS domain S-box protein [Geobacteraceae bacterium]|nr:PAS domain S-box protein [Geobacteraceae bacterium]